MTALSARARGVIAAGFDGAHFDPQLPEFGAYVLFARNAGSLAQVRALTGALRGRAEPPPLIAIDQEGGRVVRLRDGVEAMPSMMALGAAGDAELAQRAGEQIAFDLRRAGCTLNLAPVLDLATYAEDAAIGTRSLGSDPPAVAALGEALASGFERGGIAWCGKHFPGHGATALDSHLTLPEIDAGEAVLRARDLLPFAALARRAPAMMAAHAVVRAFDPQHPATLSARVANELLRGELGFDGVLMTDCLQMAAIADRGDGPEVAPLALAAGCDLLTVSHDVTLARAMAEAIERAVECGRLPRARLDEAYDRVLRLRAQAAQHPPLDLDASPPHPGAGREIARRAITLLRGVAHADPTASIAVSFEGRIAEGINTGAHAGASLAREAPALAELRAGLEPDTGEIDAIVRTLEERNRRPLLLARRAHLHPLQAHAIARIADVFPDTIVVSMLEPYDLPCFANARHLLAAYGDDAAAIGGLADVLFGGSPPEGRLPVELRL
jgi:beta-N-acetylhexosaminidase